MREGMPAEVAQWVASQRKRKDKACLVCGAAFSTIGRGLYCSKSCRDRANYARRSRQSTGLERPVADPFVAYLAGTLGYPGDNPEAPGSAAPPNFEDQLREILAVLPSGQRRLARQLLIEQARAMAKLLSADSLPQQQ